MSRSFNLILTIASVANSAAQAARGHMGFALISGLIGLLSFAAWVARAPDENKKVVDID